MLHNNKELFEQAILRTADAYGIDAGIVEKDYYVTLALREIAIRIPEIIFKGGTSLSKCHKVINRFSEDIDLTIEYESKPSESKRRNIKNNILDAIDELGFSVSNLEEIKSRREYNKYIVDYPSIFTGTALKNHLQIETMIKIKAYPNVEMDASSLIYEYLKQEGFNDLIKEYALEPFKIKVQSAERTFIDKVFAIADYFLADKTTEHSRHIYDLYKLLEIIELDDRLKELYNQVYLERKPHQVCLSAKDDVDMVMVLTEVVNKEVYKNDYCNITKLLIFDELDYDVAISAVKKVIDFLR